MSNLFRWGILPAFLMTFSGMSQDIAAPSMANVDLEMEDEKKIAAYREAMARHLQLGIIWTCIVELEEKDNRAVLVATLKYIQSPEWAGILDKCPSDYRAMHLKMIRESGKLARHPGHSSNPDSPIPPPSPGTFSFPERISFLIR